MVLKCLRYLFWTSSKQEVHELTLRFSLGLVHSWASMCKHYRKKRPRFRPASDPSNTLIILSVNLLRKRTLQHASSVGGLQKKQLSRSANTSCEALDLELIAVRTRGRSRISLYSTGVGLCSMAVQCFLWLRQYAWHAKFAWVLHSSFREVHVQTWGIGCWAGLCIHDGNASKTLICGFSLYSKHVHLCHIIMLVARSAGQYLEFWLGP